MTRYTIAVLCPVLARPHRVVLLVESVRAASRVTGCRTVFVATEGDTDEIAAIRQVEAGDVTLIVVPSEDEGYSRKINTGFAETTEPFVFMAADDLDFRPGCFERMLATHLETGACVVGTNDGGHAGTASGDHSTHSLVCREYGDCGLIDAPDSRLLLNPTYRHWFCDNELVGTAKHRQTYAHAKDALVVHLHPNWKKADMDATYAKGQSTIAEDRATFESRKRLWS